MKKPGVYTHTTLFNIHPSLPGAGKWKFALGRHISAIRNRMSKLFPGVLFKYYVIGHRNGHNEKIGELHPTLVIQVPRFIVHAMPIGSPEPNCLVFGKHEMLISGPSPYKWVDVGKDDLVVKMLVSTVRGSSRSLANTSHADGELYTDGHLWFPEPLDPQQNPAEESGIQLDNDTLIIDRSRFKAARSAIMTDYFLQYKNDNPDWDNDLSSEETRNFRIKKKLAFWNDIFMTEDEEAWLEAMQSSGLLEKIREYWVETCEIDEDAIEQAWPEVVREFERVLRAFKPQQMEQAELWNDCGPSFVDRTVHFKIFPENEVLQSRFLHADNNLFINPLVGKAYELFPKPVGDKPETVWEEVAAPTAEQENPGMGQGE